VPFSQAPSAVVHARDLIQTRALDALKLGLSFNEVLSAAYMEKQKMAVRVETVRLFTVGLKT
jgi:hypothetical protein